MFFCAVFIRISVRFWGIRAPLTPLIYDVAGFSLPQFLLRGVGVCAQAIKLILTSDRIKLRGSHPIQQEIRHLLQNKFALG